MARAQRQAKLRQQTDVLPRRRARLQSELPSQQTPGRITTRGQKSAARREAILAAALDEFSEQGFARARLDNVAQRAGVAKGTIYWHFAHKEALFQELVRSMLGPLVARLHELSATEQSIDSVLEQFVDLFQHRLYGTRRRDIVYLVISEGARFPKLAEFYFNQVIESGMTAMRMLLERASKRGEIPHKSLAQFPQLVVAPAVLAVIWASLFERFAHLDAAAMMGTHVEILLGRRKAS